RGGASPLLLLRRDDANRFRAAWEAGNRVANILAPEIDAVLHRERLAHGKKRLHPMPMQLKKLPDGAMLHEGEESFLIARGRALVWSTAGYRQERSALGDAVLLK